MTTVTVRSGLDTWANKAQPSRNYGGAIRLHLLAGQRNAFVFFKSPVPRGATVVSAKLRLTQANDLTGSVTLTARRVASSWKAGRLTWSNAPGIVGAASTRTKSGPKGGAVWEFDVTHQLQTIANGSANYGFRIVTDASSALRLYSLNAPVRRPELVVTYSDKPDAPTTLIPSGGAVSIAKPVLRFDYSDPANRDELDAVQVQLAASGDFGSPDFDSGWIATTDPELDLAETTYAGLADGASTSWRARVRDATGLVSAWSDPATFSRDDKGTLTLHSPGEAPNDYVAELTPPISWSLAGETQKAFRLLVAHADDPNTYIYDSGKRVTATTEHTLPRGVLEDDERYLVIVRVFDTKNRVGTPGDPTYVSIRREFAVAYDSTIDSVENLTATQIGESPAVRLTWSRATLPDEWVIVRDDKAIEQVEIAGDLIVSGTTYAFVDYGAAPAREHTYRVRAKVNGKTSTGNRAAKVMTMPVGVWLADPDFGRQVKIRTVDVDNVAYGEDAQTLIPLGAKRVVRKTVGMRGLEGTITGIIEDTVDGRSWRDHEADLLAMKRRPGATYRLVFGDVSIPVILGNVSISPSRDTLAHHIQKQVSFDFWQNGSLPFRAVL